jgi:hypothetical protein
MADLNGTYYARPKSWQLGKSATKGTPQVEVLFEITSAEAAGQRLPWYGYLTPDALKYTVRVLDLIGFTGNDIDAIGTDAMPAPADVEVSLEIAPETYNGKTRSKIQFVNDPNFGGLTSKRMDPAEAKAFAGSLRAQLKGLQRAAPPKPIDDTPF